jgi:hypothetical protein
MALIEAAQKTFEVQRHSTVQTDEGWRQDWVPVAELVGVLASASTADLMRAQQQDFTTTHRLIQKGAPHARLGDRLVLNDRHFLIQAADNVAQMDRYTIYHCEERH